MTLFEDSPPERPLNCSECRRPIKILYTQVIGKEILRHSLCAQCPELDKLLYGTVAPTTTAPTGEADLICGQCGTPLEAIRKGAPLGCSECYSVFKELLIQELLNSPTVPPTTKQTKQLHKGRGPKVKIEMSPSLQLLALNEALNETLAREDYEGAAILRDKIRSLTAKEESDESR